MIRPAPTAGLPAQNLGTKGVVRSHCVSQVMLTEYPTNAPKMRSPASKTLEELRDVLKYAEFGEVRQD